ncbi:hypothetical protein AMECASPLE_009123 [Ameca splendens]|uniref:Uncharacterized protein n=1 Tax=Ameca splendens TaxID=208324 RepID=A0ABV0ZJV3_9TELE
MGEDFHSCPISLLQKSFCPIPILGQSKKVFLSHPTPGKMTPTSILLPFRMTPAPILFLHLVFRQYIQFDLTFYPLFFRCPCVQQEQFICGNMETFIALIQKTNLH